MCLIVFMCLFNVRVCFVCDLLCDCIWSVAVSVAGLCAPCFLIGVNVLFVIYCDVVWFVCC